jgi:hypothetical protein
MEVVENTIMPAMFNFGVPLALLAAIFGFRWREGLWGNTIAAICVMFSIFFAVAWWETVADMLAQAMPSILFLSDLVAIWLIFLASLAILNELTLLLSRVKVLFLLPIEAVGNLVVLTFLFLLMYNFFLFTVDLAPIGAEKDVQTPADSVLIGTFRMLSTGTLEAFDNPRQFDATGKFRENHLLRRKALQQHAESKEGSLFYEGSIPPRQKN